MSLDVNAEQARSRELADDQSDRLILFDSVGSPLNKPVSEVIHNPLVPVSEEVYLLHGATDPDDYYRANVLWPVGDPTETIIAGLSNTTFYSQGTAIRSLILSNSDSNIDRTYADYGASNGLFVFEDGIYELEISAGVLREDEFLNSLYIQLMKIETGSDDVEITSGTISRNSPLISHDGIRGIPLHTTAAGTRKRYLSEDKYYIKITQRQMFNTLNEETNLYDSFKFKFKITGY